MDGILSSCCSLSCCISIILILLPLIAPLIGIADMFGSLNSLLTVLKNSYTNSAGVPMQCDPATETQNGALCYQKCDGTDKMASGVCWPDCPSGFTDSGVACTKPASYGRGAGYKWFLGALTDDYYGCERDHGVGNCEWNGALAYPKCAANFHSVGCCVCSPDCPSNTVDSGVSCTKNSYVRAPKSLHVCPSGTIKDPKGALCYPPCKTGYHAVGPVCYQN